MPPFTPQNLLVTPEPRRLKTLALVVVAAFILVLGLSGYFLNRSLATPVSDFPVDVPITIQEGSTARVVAEQFAEAGFVGAGWQLYLSLIWWYDPTAIKATTYVFSKPLSPRAIAGEITTGHFAHNLISLTIPEGERATAIAEIAATGLSNFDTERFLTLAVPQEGKLFPDTYFVPETFTADELYALLTTTYRERVHEPYFATQNATKLSEEEVIILASILEREANTPESMGMVAGILHNRLEIDMALQVDASMEYVLDKPLKELTPADLDIDSPYNTYLHPGLPPTPIGNPGLTAIKAILEPTPSEYFYYITGTDGQFYYAETYDQHRLNIERYLR